MSPVSSDLSLFSAVLANRIFQHNSPDNGVEYYILSGISLEFEPVKHCLSTYLSEKVGLYVSRKPQHFFIFLEDSLFTHFFPFGKRHSYSLLMKSYNH